MKEEFNFNRIGKRMPYTAPEGFLDDIETNVWETIKDETTPSKSKRNYRLWYSISGGHVAHCCLSSTRCPTIKRRTT